MKTNLRSYLFRSLVVGALLLSLTACAGQQYNMGMQGAAGGALAGAVLGQIIGRDTTATLIGATAGTLFGYIVGNEMDKYDQARMADTFNSAPSNQPVAWSNPDTGAQHQMIPQQPYNPANPQDPFNSPPLYGQVDGSQVVCREAKIQSVIEGRQEQLYAKACRDPYDGKWHIQQ